MRSRPRVADLSSLARYASTCATAASEHSARSLFGNKYSAVMTKGEIVIAISENVRDYILQNYPNVPAERIQLIHRGVDPLLPKDYQPTS